MSTTAEEQATGADADEGVIHVLWMNGGLSCDGDSVALTAATQPSIEEIVLGALPGLPKIAVHWPLIDFECGPEQGADNFIEWWHKADAAYMFDHNISQENLVGVDYCERMVKETNPGVLDRADNTCAPTTW